MSSDSTQLPSSAVPATRVRFTVLTYLCLLSFVLYLDRVCIHQAGPAIQREMGLSNQELGYVYASFTVAYGLFMAAAGRLSDRFGSRKVLIAIVLWWSAFTAITGLCTGFLMLIVVRFIFGIGEAGALPNCARILSRWFPAEARGFPQGLLNTAMLVGGAVAPFTVAHMMDLLDRRLSPWFLEQFGMAPSGWRWTFFIFGSLGVFWALMFYYGYRDDPAEHPGVNAAERDFIRKGRENEKFGPPPAVPWGIVLRSRNVWLMGLIIVCSAFCSYFYMSWLPKYLQSGRGVEATRSGELASLVLAGGAAGSLCGGLISDFVMRRTRGRKRSRSVIGALSMGSSGLMLLVSLQCDDALLACIVVAVAFFLMMLMIASWWGAVSDISGPHTATLFGLMNSIGVIGAAGSQIFTGWLADFLGKRGLSGRDQWDPGFYFFVGALSIGLIAWSLVDSNKSAVEVPTPSLIAVD